MSRLPRLNRCAWVCGVLLQVNLCLAQPGEPVELTWEAPQNCSQLSEVQQQLRVLVGTSSNELTSPLRAHGTIEPLGKRYRLTLVIERSTTRGMRVIESDDCHSLGKAAAVVLGLLVQKERALGRELSESEISGQPQPPSETGRNSLRLCFQSKRHLQRPPSRNRYQLILGRREAGSYCFALQKLPSIS